MNITREPMKQKTRNQTKTAVRIAYTGYM